MPSRYVSTQGQAWDQIALERLGSEKQMGAVPPVNVDEMDTLLFGGEKALTVPQAPVRAVRNLPPWERM